RVAALRGRAAAGLSAGSARARPAARPARRRSLESPAAFGGPAMNRLPRLALTALAALAPAAASGRERLVERQIERNLERVDESVLTSPALQVVLCGTGSPIADRERAAACTAVIAGGHFVLVDVGPGAWETLDLANLPVGHVD